MSEMITYDGANGKIDAYLAKPASAQDKKLGGVILIHAIFGLDAHIKDVADRIATRGYAVLAPNIFSFDKDIMETFSPENVSKSMEFMRTLDRTKMRDPQYMAVELQKQPEAMRPAIQKVLEKMFGGLPHDKLVAEGVKAVEYLRAQSYVNGKVGIMGFCFGGGISGNVACRTKTDACVIFYGENPSPIDLVAKIQGPLLGLYGAEDERINSDLDKFVAELTKNKKEFEMKIYENAAHAFFDDTSKFVYNERAAKDAWSKVVALFEKTLGAPAA